MQTQPVRDVGVYAVGTWTWTRGQIPLYNQWKPVNAGGGIWRATRLTSCVYFSKNLHLSPDSTTCIDWICAEGNLITFQKPTIECWVLELTPEVLEILPQPEAKVKHFSHSLSSCPCLIIMTCIPCVLQWLTLGVCLQSVNWKHSLTWYQICRLLLCKLRLL